MFASHCNLLQLIATYCIFLSCSLRCFHCFFTECELPLLTVQLILAGAPILIKRMAGKAPFFHCQVTIAEEAAKPTRAPKTQSKAKNPSSSGRSEAVSSDAAPAGPGDAAATTQDKAQGDAAAGRKGKKRSNSTNQDKAGPASASQGKAGQAGSTVSDGAGTAPVTLAAAAPVDSAAILPLTSAPSDLPPVASSASAAFAVADTAVNAAASNASSQPSGSISVTSQGSQPPSSSSGPVDSAVGAQLPTADSIADRSPTAPEATVLQAPPGLTASSAHIHPTTASSTLSGAGQLLAADVVPTGHTLPPPLPAAQGSGASDSALGHENALLRQEAGFVCNSISYRISRRLCTCFSNYFST